MEAHPTLIWEIGFTEFLFVTVLLGGGAAWMTGRAVAQSWKPVSSLVIYVVLLAAAVRFIHFALFHGTLIAPWYYLVDLVVLGAIAWAGMRFTRARQMATQYSFAFDASGPFGWKRR